MQAIPAVLLLRSHHSSSRKQDGSAGSQIEIAAFLLPLPFFLPGVILVDGKRKIAKSVYDIRAHTGVRNAKPQLPSGSFPAVFRFQNRRHLEARDPRCTDPAPARLEILCLRKTAGQICVIFNNQYPHVLCFVPSSVFFAVYFLFLRRPSASLSQALSIPVPLPSLR